MTGWGFTEIMEELPFSAGQQIIDADHFAKGIDRTYTRGAPSFDSLSLIDGAFTKLGLT